MCQCELTNFFECLVSVLLQPFKALRRLFSKTLFTETVFLPHSHWHTTPWWRMGEWRFLALVMRNLGTRGMCVVSFTPQTLYSGMNCRKRLSSGCCLSIAASYSTVQQSGDFHRPRLYRATCAALVFRASVVRVPDMFISSVFLSLSSILLWTSLNGDPVTPLAHPAQNHCTALCTLRIYFTGFGCYPSCTANHSNCALT